MPTLSESDKTLLKGSRVAIVQARWHAEHTDRMVIACTDMLVQTGCVKVSLFQVPGCYELPLAVKRLAKGAGSAQSERAYDAIVTFGAIVKGETDHYQVILDTCIREIGRAMYELEVPIIMEIMPVHQLEDLIARSKGSSNKGIEAAMATVESILWHRAPRPVWSRGQ